MFMWCFQQVNEDQVQQMERENSFITRWNDKKDTTVSQAAEPKWKSPMGVVFVCLCMCVLICPHASGSLKSGIHLSRSPVFRAKMRVGKGIRGRRRRQEQAGEEKGLCSC